MQAQVLSTPRLMPHPPVLKQGGLYLKSASGKINPTKGPERRCWPVLKSRPEAAPNTTQVLQPHAYCPLLRATCMCHPTPSMLRRDTHTADTRPNPKPGSLGGPLRSVSGSRRRTACSNPLAPAGAEVGWRLTQTGRDMSFHSN